MDWRPHRNRGVLSESRQPDNILYTACDIERIFLMLDERDRVERIYINFCNPWNRAKQRKKRLTHPKQLRRYLNVLSKRGEIWFKTDDRILFEDTLGYLSECGLQLIYLTRDLAASGFEPNIKTEHEQMFESEGKKTSFLIARRRHEYD